MKATQKKNTPAASKKGVLVSIKGKRNGKSAEAGLPAGLQLFTLEDNVPIPARGSDPEFEAKLNGVMQSMKQGQSFVVPKPKLHATKQFIGKNFGDYVVKTAVIQPEQKFVRIWRTK